MVDLLKLSSESLEVRRQADVLGHLFDLIETSYVFVKDREHRFVRVKICQPG